MGTVLQVLLGLVILGALEALFYLVRYLQERKVANLARRLKALGDGKVTGSVLLRQGRLSSIGVINDLLQAVGPARALERLLEQADLDTTVAMLISISLALGGCGVLAGFLLHAGLVIVILFGLIGLCLPLVGVLVMRSKRSAKISEQLPEALEMMTRSLRAGHALEQAFHLVATEAPSPINVEFGRAFEEQKLGRTLEQTVVGIANRVPNNPDLNIFAVSVAVQKETGGNLTELLDKLAETIRSRFRFYGKLRSLTAEGRVSGIVLGSLPIAMLMLLVIVNYSYVKPLFESRDGNLILAAAGAVWLVGVVALFRLAKVEY
ncbi:MAG: type II secretion system F family protein [Deltaproteobacteria bacterium]|nr:type II secretion system F family protein [Deltaproteobacteria bacterium]